MEVEHTEYFSDIQFKIKCNINNPFWIICRDRLYEKIVQTCIDKNIKCPNKCDIENDMLSIAIQMILSLNIGLESENIFDTVDNESLIDQILEL